MPNIEIHFVDSSGIVISCRILVPGTAEIDPVDNLEWENNSVGNGLRAAILRLPDLAAADARGLR